MKCNYTKTMGSDVGITDTTSQIPLGIMKTYTLIALLCLMAAPTWASHLLGGHIQAQYLSGTTYSLRIQLFLDHSNGQVASDQMNTISVCMGDGTVLNVSRGLQFLTANPTVSVNIYQATYTYNGPGTYRITTSIVNRTPLVNLTQTNQTAFTLSTTILSTPNLRNTTPSFTLQSEFWQVGTNQRTSLPFRVADVDGDSLVYLLTRPLTTRSATSCEGTFGVDQYQFPNAVSNKGTYKLNARTGELIWDAPTTAGQYSAAIRVQEWRGGILISESYLETFIRVQDKSGATTTIPPYEPAAEISIVTGIGPEADNDLVLTVSPNPAQSQFVVRLRSNKATKASLQLLDLSGRVVAEKALTRPSIDHETTFLVENLPSGLYVLKAEVGSRVISQKVMKQ